MRTWPAPNIPALPVAANLAPVRVFDSATGTLVEAAPGSIATLYACGITPYDATHLGHANTYLAFDLLQRAWLDAGKQVTYASNITDVDDPLLERAAATGVDWRELAREQTELFRADMTALRMLPPNAWVSVVAIIPDVVAAVAGMLARGEAYWVDGDVYADLSADPWFGTVAGLAASDPATLALFGERGGDPERPGKRHPLDPALWRAERPGDPSWEGGQLGRGRPGWHIECAVIARDALGLPFDIQGGGTDLRFPHHEMSSSHARLIGGGAARTHMHAGLVAYQGEKMSKSRGNLVFVSRLLADGVDPMAIRLALLFHHYREEWEWTDADLARGVECLAVWRQGVAEAHRATGLDGGVADRVVAGVRAALADDLNAPRALSLVDEWAALQSCAPGGPAAAQAVAEAIDALLGIRL
ncbi:MAG: cysteine--1-D-myo-inosityl 2-amino-2-deoxy-alpha-D-glucopyranoside ligase [Promicromonosporaceae bacterium]|nr:cysteine--1-D-myo-inosityl 2-amino-2-deoxy-alpha-D-glucopyranoside ligase [Promicromonosporaceae bacterium]